MADVRARVFEQVRRCMANLIVEGGQVASCRLLEESFEIAGAVEIGNGLTEYAFRVKGWMVTEFGLVGDAWSEVRVAPKPLEGSLVLDGDFKLARDEEGKVRLQPWACMDPDSGGEEGGGGDPFEEFFKP